MRFCFLLAITLLFAVAESPAQRLENPPDFSGRWIYNYKESGPEKEKLPILQNFKIFRAIRQDASKITIVATSEPVADELPGFTQTIYLDGRSVDLPGVYRMRERGFRATITWEGAKLVTRLYDKSKKLVHLAEIQLLASGRKIRFYYWNIDSSDIVFDGYEVFDRVSE